MTPMAFPPDLVVDTSALLAILLPEPEGPACLARLMAARQPVISSVAKVELFIVLSSRQPGMAESYFSRLVECSGLVVVGVNEAVADLAIDAFYRYGKGRHPAGLNFGDCFSYALARRLGLPLLFKGEDFSITDVGAPSGS